MRHHLLVLTCLLGFGAKALAQQSLRVTGLDDEAPLTITATATPARLCVRVALEDEWHLYGRDIGAGRPVAVEVLTGSGFSAAGPLEFPMNAKGEIVGTAELVLPLERTGSGTGFEAVFRFQVCDALMCLAPAEVTLSGEIRGDAKALSVLLGVQGLGERSRRIERFLDEAGFRVTVRPYAMLSAEVCDAHDVVIADSPYYGQTRGSRATAAAFPRTRSPLIAVGLIGTDVLEAQRIAMACGYI